MLIGQYTHSIDDKNRLSLPAKFRKEMGKSVVITPGLDGCLFVFTVKQWDEFSKKLSQGSFSQSDSRSFNRFMFGGAIEAEVDTIGRILVPDFLKERAKLKEKVVIIGVQDRVEIWNEDSWSDYKKMVEKQADSLAERLGQIGAL